MGIIQFYMQNGSIRTSNKIIKQGRGKKRQVDKIKMMIHDLEKKNYHEAIQQKTVLV